MTASVATHADRLRLLREIALARRAVDLLHNKEEALERERVRLRGHAARAAERWEQAWVDAAVAATRARMLGAGPEIDRFAGRASGAATVTPEWSRSMGIEYPGAVTCEPVRAEPLGSTAAMLGAASAARAAVLAAAEAAAADEAVRRLDRELASTRRRRRAVDEHRLPMLESKVHELELRLDELDREEALRIRTATTRREGP